MDAVATPQNQAELAALYGRLFQMPPSITLQTDDLDLIEEGIWFVRQGDLESLVEIAENLTKRYQSFYHREPETDKSLALRVSGKLEFDGLLDNWLASKGDISDLSDSSAIVRWLELFLNFYAYEKDGLA